MHESKSRKIELVCFECEAKAHHAHHVVPRVLGGTKTVTLCSICHAKIHGDHLLRTSELTKAGMKKAKDAGFYVYGRAPFGSMVVDGRLRKNNREQKIIKEIVKMKDAGTYLSTISDVIEAKHGVKLSISSIKRIVVREKNENIIE
jgi:hypothetical protein